MVQRELFTPKYELPKQLLVTGANYLLLPQPYKNILQAVSKTKANQLVSVEIRPVAQNSEDYIKKIREISDLFPDNRGRIVTNGMYDRADFVETHYVMEDKKFVEKGIMRQRKKEGFSIDIASVVAPTFMTASDTLEVLKILDYRNLNYSISLHKPTMNSLVEQRKVVWNDPVGNPTFNSTTLHYNSQ